MVFEIGVFKIEYIGKNKEEGNDVIEILAPVKRNYAYFSQLAPEKYREELTIWYQQITGEKLDLDYPKTFNQKIQWLKLYDSTPLKTRLADKYLVRDWVKEKVGEEYLIPLLGVWDSFDEIDFNQLPNRFVLKTNHGCGWNLVVKDKSSFNKDEAKIKFDRWMNKNYAFSAGFELHYMNIPPKIVAEAYLENENDVLHDYKVFCFDGKAESILYVSDHGRNLTRTFYDLEWNQLPFTYSDANAKQPCATLEEPLPKPHNLERLIELSEKLAQGFAMVRVDFYVLNDGTLKFGEMTFTSMSGICSWNPPEQDRIYGELIKLPPKSPFPQRQY